MAEDIIWRLPPFRIDSEVLSLAGDQKIDWGVLAHSVPESWKHSRGKGVRVAVLDTGAGEHNDLPTAAFKHNFTSSRYEWDRNGHSTHCAGIIGARDNDTGVVGVAPECEIGYCKVLGDDGSGSTSWIAKGIRKAISEKADIISMSIGGGYSSDVQKACQEAIDAGCFILAAAGNSGYRGRNSIDYPGKLQETICVAAYRSDGKIADFSSGGDEIDIACPGERILSTYPGNQYRVMSGTSMATPFAAGIIALMIASGNRPKNLYELRDVLSKNAEDAGQQGKDVRFGWGKPKLDGLVYEHDGDGDDLFYFW